MVNFKRGTYAKTDRTYTEVMIQIKQNLQISIINFQLDSMLTILPDNKAKLSALIKKFSSHLYRAACVIFKVPIVNDGKFTPFGHCISVLCVLFKALISMCFAIKSKST